MLARGRFVCENKKEKGCRRRKSTKKPQRCLIRISDKIEDKNPHQNSWRKAFDADFIYFEPDIRMIPISEKRMDKIRCKANRRKALQRILSVFPSEIGIKHRCGNLCGNPAAVAAVCGFPPRRL